MAGGFTHRGFIVNEAELEGSVVLLPRSAFLWKPKTIEEVTVESLSLVSLLEPGIEILLIGCGDRQRRPSDALASYFRDLGVVVCFIRGSCAVYCAATRPKTYWLRTNMLELQVEQSSTSSAIGTFNILNTEDRLVAAALLHPSCDWADSEETKA